jgi:oxygen-independent coproporphyrinogen-3 oxidase
VVEWRAALDAGRVPSAEEETLTSLQVRNERLMLALRTAEGLEVSLLSPAQSMEVQALVRSGLATRRGGRISLTPRGMDLHSAVAERLFEPSASARPSSLEV